MQQLGAMNDAAGDVADAKSALADAGIPYTQDEFFRRIREGDSAYVAQFIAAGMSPNARLDGESALAAAINAHQPEVVKVLVDRGARAEELLSGLHKGRKTKDVWEKLASCSGTFTFIASLTIAAVGWYFTNSYNTRQLALSGAQAERDAQAKEYQNRLAEIQTVERMIPHLVKDEPSKQAALIVISTLASPRLATQIAETFGGKGAVDAVEKIAAASPAEVPTVLDALANLSLRETTNGGEAALRALERVLSGREKSVVRVLNSDRTSCSGFVANAVAGIVATAGYCVRDAAPESVKVLLYGAETPLTVNSIKRSANGAFAFLDVGRLGVAPLRLSERSPLIGGPVLQLSVTPERKLGVVVGKIKESRADAPADVWKDMGVQSVPTLTVAFDAGWKKVPGAGGGPLLDGEGNVACMTFAVLPSGEICVAARAIAEAMRELGLLRRWAVIFGADRTLSQAVYEVEQAKRVGIPGARVVFREGSYRSIAVVDDRALAEELLAKAKARRPDSYITDMNSWCPVVRTREGLQECTLAASS